MKNNSKNRKLKFIRQKNRIRLGKESYFVFFKVSNRFINNEEAIKVLTEGFINKALFNLFYNFKIEKVRKIFFSFGEFGEDFLINAKTLKIELSNK